MTSAVSVIEDKPGIEPIAGVITNPLIVEYSKKEILQTGPGRRRKTPESDIFLNRILYSGSGDLSGRVEQSITQLINECDDPYGVRFTDIEMLLGDHFFIEIPFNRRVYLRQQVKEILVMSDLFATQPGIQFFKSSKTKKIYLPDRSTCLKMCQIGGSKHSVIDCINLPKNEAFTQGGFSSKFSKALTEHNLFFGEPINFNYLHGEVEIIQSIWLIE